VLDVQGYCDVLIALRADPLKQKFHLQVVEPMGDGQKKTRFVRMPNLDQDLDERRGHLE
jgi:hypothetical protein